MFQQPRGAGGQGPAWRGPGGPGVKLMISNLDYGVSTDDIKVWTRPSVCDLTLWASLNV